MVLSNRNIGIAYFLIAALSIFFLISGRNIGYFIFKPLIVPIMLLLLFRHLKNNTHEILPPLIIATIFSWLGDMLSIIPVDEAFFKMCSICTFVVAQACYAYVFYLSVKNKVTNKKITWVKRWPEAICIFLFIVTLYIVIPYLGYFLMPGLFYALVASLAILFALNRRFYVSYLSYYWVILGICFFFMCDVLTGLDMFQTNTLLNGIILLFYILGHYFVINGMLIQVLQETKNEKASETDALTKSYF